MHLNLWPGKRGRRPASGATAGAALGGAVSHRTFLKLALATLGGAGLGQLAAGARMAEATYTPGPPDVVDTNLTVQGNLVVDQSVGIGVAAPSGTGNLDVANAICINGTQVTGSDGHTVLQSYYAQ